MKRIYITTAALCAATIALTALSKCRLPQAATASTIATIRTASNVTADECEVQAGWRNASVILRFTTPGKIGEIVLMQGEKITRVRAHAYAEGFGKWYAEWGATDENHIRIFANGHAEGRIDGQFVYFTPLGSGQCLPE